MRSMSLDVSVIASVFGSEHGSKPPTSLAPLGQEGNTYNAFTSKSVGILWTKTNG